LPADVVAYLTMAMCLLAEDDCEEVATKVTQSGAEATAMHGHSSAA
jgi:Insertion element 4 transposase N-terminal